MADLKAPITFEIPKQDILRLLVGEMKLEIQRGSYFYGIQASSDPGVKAQYEDMLVHPAFQKAAAMASAPEAFVVMRVGGGSMALEEIRLHKKLNDRSAIAAVAETDKDFVIQWYESDQDFLRAWCEAYGANPDETAANYIPPKVTLEEFLFILHSVDAFRRVSFENMLNYSPAETPAMTFADFATTMTASLRSGDIRWLLPAFMVLVPGIHEYELKMASEQAAVLMDKGFMLHAELEKPEDDVLVFGEAGRVMGVEFYRTWLQGFGFELNVSDGTSFKAVNRLFVAPTALANHFVQLEATTGNHALVNHQAYTKDQLIFKLEEIFSKAFSDPAPVLSETREVGAGQTTETPKTLEKNQTKPIEKFCGNCGTPFNDTALFCANCGTKRQ